MFRKLETLILVAVLFASSAGASTIQDRTGTVATGHGAASVSVYTNTETRTTFATLFTTDDYGVQNIIINLKQSEVIELRDAFQKAAEIMAQKAKSAGQPKLDKEASNMNAQSSSNKNKVILGVNVIDLPPSIASGLHRENMKAALIVAISPGSISDKAGFKVGDVIYEFDGKPIEQYTDLQKVVSETDAGRKISVKLLRGEKELSIDAQF